MSVARAEDRAKLTQHFDRLRRDLGASDTGNAGSAFSGSVSSSPGTILVDASGGIVMQAASLHVVLRHLRTATVHDESDPSLVERFVAARDEAAFAALVQRHGPMVLAVCRRLLSGTRPLLPFAFSPRRLAVFAIW